MSEIEVRILIDSEYSLWDQLVDRSAQGTIFHSSKWITTVAKNLHIDHVIIGVFKGSYLIGGCFFYIKKIFNIFKIGYSDVPVTPFGGIITFIPNSNKVRVSEEREHQIIFIILEKLQTLKFSNISLMNNQFLSDIRPFKQQEWNERVNYTYVVSLEKDILSNLSNKVRTNVRKAQKNGFTVEKKYSPDLFWELSKLMYAKQSINIPFQKGYLFSLMEMVHHTNSGDMWIAKTQSGEPISALFILYDPHMAQAWVAANDPKFQNTGVISLIFFEAFTDLQKNGFEMINMMGANIPRLAKFYSSFNPKLMPYYRVEKSQGVMRILNAVQSIIR
jgi:hypothetical protein